MKIHVFLSFLLLFATTVYSKNQGAVTEDSLKSKQEQFVQQYLKPKAIFNSAYDEFHFSSSQGGLFNQYSGHNNINLAGGDNLKFYNLYWGFNFFNITSNTDSAARLNNATTQSHGLIEDNGFYLHVMKQLAPLIFVDVFASMGRDRYKQNTIVKFDGVAPFSGFANYYGKDSTVGGRTFFGYAYKRFYLQGDVTYFYSNFYQPDYILTYPIQNVGVPALTTKIGTLLENARLYYQANPYFSPFVSGGLIQLTSRTFSRPIVDANFVAVSPLPQLLLAKNGYKYGVGVDFHYKSLRITPLFVHSVRGSTYSDNYGGISFELSALN